MLFTGFALLCAGSLVLSAVSVVFRVGSVTSEAASFVFGAEPSECGAVSAVPGEGGAEPAVASVSSAESVVSGLVSLGAASVISIGSLKLDAESGLLAEPPESGVGSVVFRSESGVLGVASAVLDAASGVPGESLGPETARSGAVFSGDGISDSILQRLQVAVMPFFDVVALLAPG